MYWWADGIHFKVRLIDEWPCLLVIMGTLDDDTKELGGMGVVSSQFSFA